MKNTIMGFCDICKKPASYKKVFKGVVKERKCQKCKANINKPEFPKFFTDDILPLYSANYITNLGNCYYSTFTEKWTDCFLNFVHPEWWQDKIIEELKPESKKEVGGYRYNAGKLDWSLIDFASLESLVKVLEFGAKKYARGNWQQGLKFNDTINSIMRHLIKFKEIGNNDEESGLSHLGHIMANVMFLEYMIKNNKGLDDRNLPKNEEKK